MTESVLVVDDDDDIREILSSLLSRQGFRVITAADGGEAMERLQAGERPGLILLDLMMPHVSGEEFRARQLAEPNLAEIPVIVLSGAGAIHEFAGKMSVEVIPKPIELSLLISTVKRFCTPGAR
jgi:CheY-like chemotaxis protein